MNINSIKEKLKVENENEELKYGEGFLLASIHVDEIDMLKKMINKLFNVEVSNDYVELLKLSNGFSVNGLNIYGASQYNEDYVIDGILDINSEFWTEPTLRKYLSYGDESSTRLVYNMDSLKYEAVDSITWEMIESFQSFSELLCYVLDECQIFE